MRSAPKSHACAWLAGWLFACGHGAEPPVAPTLRPAPEPPPTPIFASDAGPGQRLYVPAWVGPPPPDTPAPGNAGPAPHAGPGQVALWRDGRQVEILDRGEAAAAGLLLLDVGRNWAPYLLRSTPDKPNVYEPHFIELANGRFPDTPEGDRARRDRYLELYGIPPTPALLSERLRDVLRRACDATGPSSALQDFEGVAWDEEGDAPDQPVDPAIVEAVQRRLHCDGHLRSTPSGKLDLKTRWALEEFERRHRIYSLGSLQGETLEALKATSVELERRALLRVLTERLLLDLGVIEDGSGVSAPQGAGRLAEPFEPSVDVVAQLGARLRSALGLATLEGVRDFYGRLGDALGHPHYLLAIDPIELPRYYTPSMDLFVEIDRGDVYYDFPYDEAGHRRPQPIERYPTVTLYARDDGVVIPLARYGTTIGGWRILRIGERDVFAYKESPVGTRVWQEIVAAPVWLPPKSTPPSALVLEARQDLDGELVQEVNLNLVGPSYASAYGLVAAYHRRPARDRLGQLRGGIDDGIRTHGSSDYTSIWRRASHGCHRLHNHLALRLFNFVLAHERHRRIGTRPARYRRSVNVGSLSTVIEIDRSGYTFELETPIEVEVLPGRVRGALKHASHRRIPADAILNGHGTS